MVRRFKWWYWRYRQQHARAFEAQLHANYQREADEARRYVQWCETMEARAHAAISTKQQDAHFYKRLRKA